jgi:hypothetical protein
MLARCWGRGCGADAGSFPACSTFAASQPAWRVEADRSMLLKCPQSRLRSVLAFPSAEAHRPALPPTSLHHSRRHRPRYDAATGPYVVRIQARGYWFHALALAGQQQPRAIRLQRNHTISVPCGPRHAIKIGRKAFRLGAWRHRVGAHEQQLNTIKVRTGLDSQREKSIL